MNSSWFHTHLIPHFQQSMESIVVLYWMQLFDLDCVVYNTDDMYFNTHNSEVTL